MSKSVLSKTDRAALEWGLTTLLTYAYLPYATNTYLHLVDVVELESLKVLKIQYGMQNTDKIKNATTAPSDVPSIELLSLSM